MPRVFGPDVLRVGNPFTPRVPVRRNEGTFPDYSIVKSYPSDGLFPSISTYPGQV